MKGRFVSGKMILKRCALWLAILAVMSAIMRLIIFLAGSISQNFPGASTWVVPILSAVIFVSIGAVFWHSLSRANVLKYEFITVVTHKFRTPLTRIKWAAEDMVANVPVEKSKNVDTILESEHQLMALTDILVHMSVADLSRFDYYPAAIDVETLFANLSSQYLVRAQKKHIKLVFSPSPRMCVMADAEKSGFVFQILLDNAFSYTPEGGSISVSSHPDPDGRYGVVEVSDSGIGMSPKTASMVFRQFFRGENARQADTEGMGVGLFMAKSIIEKQSGKIYAKSDGEGKGTTFFVHLPLCGR